MAPRPNLLILRIQPEEGISLRFLSKSPGSGDEGAPGLRWISTTVLELRRTLSTAYETLLVDALVGDATLYRRARTWWRPVVAGGNRANPESWSAQKFDFPNYDSGTWGPRASDEMLARNGHTWKVLP